MSKRDIIRCVLWVLWLGALAVLGFMYDWKAAAMVWLLSCCFGTAVLMDYE